MDSRELEERARAKREERARARREGRERSLREGLALQRIRRALRALGQDPATLEQERAAPGGKWHTPGAAQRTPEASPGETGSPPQRVSVAHPYGCTTSKVYNFLPVQPEGSGEGPPPPRETLLPTRDRAQGGVDSRACFAGRRMKPRWRELDRRRDAAGTPADLTVGSSQARDEWFPLLIGVLERDVLLRIRHRDHDEPVLLLREDRFRRLEELAGRGTATEDSAAEETPGPVEGPAPLEGPAPAERRKPADA